MVIEQRTVTDGLHAAVSNEPDDEADVIHEEASEAPSYGQGGEAGQVSGEGIEVGPR